MATGIGSETWFVKTEGRIRGPFTRDVLASMKARGRVTAATEVSSDRQTWFPIERLGGALGEASAPTTTTISVPSVSAGPPMEGGSGGGMSLPDVQCFFSVDGVMHGPIPLSRLRDQARAGGLAPTDRVWLDGQPDWTDAGMVPGLTFTPRKKRLGAWLMANPALTTCLTLVGIVMFVVPAWFVVGLAGDREDAITAAAEAKREALARADQLRSEKLDRLEKERKELIEQETNLVNQRLQMEGRLETTRLQMMTIVEDKRQQREIQEKFKMLETRLDEQDEEIKRNHQELLRNDADTQALLREGNDYDRRSAEADERSAQNVQEMNERDRARD